MSDREQSGIFEAERSQSDRNGTVLTEKSVLDTGFFQRWSKLTQIMVSLLLGVSSMMLVAGVQTIWDGIQADRGIGVIGGLGLSFGGLGLLGVVIWTIWLENRVHFFRWWHGSSTLKLEQSPLQLGERFRAKLHIPFSFEQGPEDGFQACLSHHSDGGLPDPSQRPEDGFQARLYYQSSLWATEISDLSGRTEAGKTVVPITVDLPDLSPENRDAVLDPEGQWTLGVGASFEGQTDYRAFFELPVVGPEAAEARTDQPGDADGEETDDASDEEVYWEVGGENDSKASDL